MKRKVIIGIVILITLSIIILVFASNKGDTIKAVLELENGKIIEVGEGDKIKSLKIVSIEETKVIVEHLGNKTECEYDKTYQFWPDSQGGQILWEFPEVVVIFERDN